MPEEATADPDTQEKTDADTQTESGDGLLEQADGADSQQDGVGGDTADADTTEDTPDVYEPSGELSKEQVESLPDHMINDDGTVNAEELAKQNLGFREKASEGTLDEALEFYEEYGDQIEELENEDGEDDGEGEEKSEADDSEEEVRADVPESPDEYEITLEDENGEEVEMDDDMESIVKEAAHNSDMSEQQLNEFVNDFEQMFNQNFSKKMDAEEELKKISDDPQQAQKTVNEVNQRLDTMYERGYLTEQEYQEAKIMGGTAEGVSVFRKFMTKMDDFDEIPTGQESIGGESTQEIQNELDELMQHDAYFDPSHPEHERVNREADQLRKKRQELQGS